MRTVLRAVLLVGVPASIGMFLCAAWVYWLTDLPQRALPAVAAFPLLTGCFLAAHAAARRLRRRALLCGLCAALLLTALWYAARCLILGEFCVPWLSVGAALCGMLGAAMGRAAEAPRIRRRSHRLIYRREKQRLLPLLLHTPKRPAEAAQKEGTKIHKEKLRFD